MKKYRRENCIIYKGCKIRICTVLTQVETLKYGVRLLEKGGYCHEEVLDCLKENYMALKFIVLVYKGVESVYELQYWTDKGLECLRKIMKETKVISGLKEYQIA